ncbi:MAG TPA: ABC transporter substrate-binding protein [Phototrophicaceae bacterium]|jgi:ABC-type nitrate/sulfonate/bicarbonate transport system substrate-binding protein|nr:ABC transporter substrate-binding protein [Candidatus Eisenbacteria bacterium]HZH85384.1 ABC transporter substrate-binding protein [Phototrophicaceae bacterium]
MRVHGSITEFTPAKSILIFFVLAAHGPVARAEQVRTVVPRATLNYLSIPVAEVKGFFRDQGLENQTIVIPGSTAIAALVSGNVDYSGAGGSGMRAALRGAPIKAVMFQTEKVTWYLLAAPDIQKISDLKGKKIAVGTIGDTQDTLITMLVEREGVSGRNITRIAMPSRNTTSTILSLKSGAFSAAVVNADESLLGEKEGLRTLAFVGDLFPYPFQGFVATDKAIAERPNDIKRWLRAMARALMLIRDKPEEAADIALKKIPMGNVSRPLVIEGIRRFAKALPEGVPGLPSAQGIKNVMEFDVKLPLKIKEEVSPDKVMNLKLMREVKEELESKR